MAALGEMAIVLERLQLLIIANSAFVAQCALDGLTPANQVFLHAHRPARQGGVVRPSCIERPFVIIAPEEFSYNEHSEGCMFPQMNIAMHINDKYRGDPESATYFHETAQNFTNFVSQFLDELSSGNRQPQNLVMRKIMQTTRPQPVARRSENDDYTFWLAEYNIQIGADIQV
ncbi:MAG: hypothetical protein E6Q97_37120 [Desulfurellales bacterium]|nr:MAG: hypothetical protein E6Q97_37120 [Desulfurellales bacterium]